MFTFEVKNHNGQCSYGIWIDCTDLSADTREFIAAAILEGDVVSGGLLSVGGQSYMVRFA